MYINATLLIQAFHFFVAYIILKQLLFKPAIAVIEGEQAEHDSLRAAVAARHVLVQQKERERLGQWREYQQQFLIKIPPLDVERYVVKGIAPVFTYESLPAKTLHEDAKRLSAAIVAQVDHVS